VEFCASLPLPMKVRAGAGKYLLKELAARKFGRAFVNRKKQGFGIPLAKWLKGSLHRRMMEVLSDRALMEPFDAATVARVACEFRTGQKGQDRTSKLWALFMYGLWRESEQPATSAEPLRAPLRAEAML
jgi:asparagine synthase (glutamine-hydrolysing)